MLETDHERVCLEARRHAVSLLKPFLRAAALAAVGTALVVAGWPLTALGVVPLVLAAVTATAAAWTWERTRIVVTTHKLFVVTGTLRRRAAAVRLAHVSALEVEQPLLGRLLGYGTLIAGDLEIPYVPQPRRVYGLVERLGA